MGSPSSRLNIPERLRPWLESGLEYVLCPDGASARTAATPSVGPASPVAPRPVRRAPDRPVQPVAASEAPGRPSSPGGSAPARRAEARRSAATEPRGPASASTPSASPRVGRSLPEPWATYAGLVSPAHKMVWTYFELGLDLGGKKDPRRRTVAANLINYLHLPPKPVAFWPVAVLHGDRLVPDRSLFWRGWSLWRTPHVVCFGAEALRVILPDADPARSTHMLRDVMVHVLPSMASLVGMLPHEQQMAVDCLSGLRL